MSAKAQMFVPKGMKRDYSASKADPQFAFENHNIRITTREDKTLLSITNEKGNSPIVLDPEISYVGIDISSSPSSDSSLQIKATLQDGVSAKGIRIKVKYLDNTDLQEKEDYIVFKDTGKQHLHLSQEMLHRFQQKCIFPTLKIIYSILMVKKNLPHSQEYVLENV